MLKKIKLAILNAADASGMSQLALKSPWRRQKLLILCYHGISLEDEHQWDPGLYMSPDLLRQRFEYLRRAKANVLPLGEAVTRLYAGDLPPRAVAITFDDGFYDFRARAWPLAQEFGYPLTVYLTTYYSYFNRPVFDPALNYLLWKGRGHKLLLQEAMTEPVELADNSWRTVASKLYRYATEAKLSGLEKDEFLQRLSTALTIDYEEFCRKRLLHLMTPEEVAEVHLAGADVQMHTHRHRVSNSRGQFEKEITENRDCIQQITRERAQHFCYPSGFYIPEYLKWLQELKVQSATTCVPGIATPNTAPLLLPRLVDTSTVTAAEFGGWVSGLASLLPKRRFQMDQGSYLSGEERG